MTTTMDTNRSQPGGSQALWHAQAPAYRIEGELREVVPVGAFGDAIRLLSRCDAKVLTAMAGTTGPAVGRVSLDVNGVVMAPDGFSMPLPAAIATPGFEFPDLDFRLTGTAYIRAVEHGLAQLEGSTVSIEGWVNFESGELVVEALPL